MQEILIDNDLISIQQARVLSGKAREAYDIFCTYSQDRVDKIIEAMAMAGVEASERLAKLAVEETGYGNVKDKITKNLFASKNVYDSIKDLKTVGVIKRDYRRKIIEIAHPMGVVCAITPTTNPTSTAIFKSLISVKSRNAIVFAPHPNAALCSKETAILMQEAAESEGAPSGLISCMSSITMEGTKELMSCPNTSIILATGGTAMVKAAHSYGKPAIGVGPGNTPVFVDRTANLEKAAKDIILSKTFDNGVICASEQAIVAHKDIEPMFRKILENNGGYFLSPQEIEKAGQVLIKKDAMNPAMVGKSVDFIANACGISIPPQTKLLIAPIEGVGREYPLSREILTPVIAYYVEDDWENACRRCIEILNFGGLGHTLVIHSADEEAINAFAHQKPVFRILINTPASQGAIGATTSLVPSLTLSTGTWGGGIYSDNISAHHLLNIKRVAYEVNPVNTAPDKIYEAGKTNNIDITNEDVGLIVKKVLESLDLKS
jgi:acetaldehyde dehydrogenase (acetylating)